MPGPDVFKNESTYLFDISQMKERWMAELFLDNVDAQTGLSGDNSARIDTSLGA